MYAFENLEDLPAQGHDQGPGAETETKAKYFRNVLENL